MTLSGRKQILKIPQAQHVLSIINTPERPYLQWLREGVKKAEGRINGPACRKMYPGETIVLQDRRSQDFVFGTITFKHVYRSFEEMLLAEGVSNMLPFLGADDLQAGVRVYQQFPGAERVKALGCVAIGIQVTNSNF